MVSRPIEGCWVLHWKIILASNIPIKRQLEFSKIFNIATGTIGMWESGKREPNYEMLQRIAKYFNVTVDYLLEDISFASYKKGKKIPVLGRIAAGIPIEAVEDIIDWEEIPTEWTKDGSEFFALSIKGDSMQPRIQNGDVVIVRKQPDIESSEVAAVLINGEDATIKKVINHENGISLVPFNSAYSPMFYTLNEVKTLPVEILGKVVELRGKF